MALCIVKGPTIFQCHGASYNAKPWGRSGLSKKEHHYQLKEKIGEDSKTRTFFAVDLRVKRPVTFIQLKKNLQDKESRLFLLQARSLGQLQHPGLLPLYDMGLHNERFFYSHRMPPGRPLSEHISGNGSTHGRSQQFTQTLIRLSDTLDYLHRNNVTLQRFTSKDISIGTYGEVVLHNFSLAIHHRKPSDDTSFKEGQQTDLKNLAELGLRMWTGSRRTEEVSIRQWDSLAQKLPIELQVIFDRAFLERGGKYPNTSHFSQDLLNFQDGLPPENRKDDLLFLMKGLLFKRKKETLALVATLAICFLYTFSKTIPIQTVTKELEELQQNKDQKEQMLSSVDSKVEELNISAKTLREDQQGRRDKLNEQREQSQAMRVLRNHAGSKRKALEKRILDLSAKREELLQSEEDWFQKAETWEQRILKQSKSIAKRGHQMAQLGEVPKRPFSIVEIREHPPSLQKFTKELNLEDGWLADYLANITGTELQSQLLPIKGKITFKTEDSNSDRLLFIHDGLTILNTASLLHENFSLPRADLKNVFFGTRDDFFYGSDSRSIVTFNQFAIQRTIPISIAGESFTLLPNGSSRQIHAWNQNNFFSGGLVREPGVPPTYNPASIPIGEGTLDVLSSQDERFWKLHNEGLDLLPLQNRTLSFDGAPDFWFSQVKDGLALLRGDQLALFPWPEHFEPMTPSHRFQVPEKFQNPNEMVGDISEGQIWLRHEESYLFLSPDHPEPLVRSDLKGELLWWKSPNLFSTHDKGILITEVSNEGMNQLVDSPTLPTNHLKDWKDTPPPGLDLQGGWESPDEPFVLVLNGKRSIEVWSQSTWSRVGHLALAREDLRGVTYRESDKTIFGLTEKGRWLKF